MRKCCHALSMAFPRCRANRSTLQAFPVAGDMNSWPRLLGRVLFIFFGGSKPAIRDLRLDASFDRLTLDIKESWATCFWTIQVCLDATIRNRANAPLAKSLESLAQRVYVVTLLQKSDLANPEIIGVISAMNERYAKRLGFEPGNIDKAHLDRIRKLS